MTNLCARCKSPLWAGHVCPAAPISGRLRVEVADAVYHVNERFAKRVLEAKK